MTFNHIRKTFTAGELNYNHSFSLAGQNFLRGFVICHTPSNKLTVAGNSKGASVVIPAKDNWESVMAPFTTG